MSLTGTNFRERFYFWALADWNRELRDNFPLLRAVYDEGPQPAVEIMEQLAPDRREAVSIALVKRFTDEDTLRRLEALPTIEERNLAEWFVEKCLARRARRSGAVVLPGSYSKAALPKKLKRKKLKRHIIGALHPILGDKYEEWGDSFEWRYRTKIGPWHVITYIDVGGQGHQLSYDHSVLLSDRVRLFEGISLLSWLGICSQTNWQGLVDGDAEPAALVLATIVAHFMEAAPKLLKGLTPDLSEVDCIK